jgi:hypothetical protein
VSPSAVRCFTKPLNESLRGACSLAYLSGISRSQTPSEISTLSGVALSKLMRKGRVVKGK